MRPLTTLLALCLLLPACPPAPAAAPTGPGPTGPGPTGPAPAAGCADKLPGEYTFYFDGLRRFQERTKLTPPGALEITRTFSGGQTRSCRVELACGKGNILNVADVAAALNDPDVQKALSPSAPFFGEDKRPVDIPAFTLEGPSGKLQVGQPCSGARCTPIPKGVERSVETLKKVYEQYKGQPACASLPETL